ncbi:MAG: hypothetical protein FVQ81_07955 [Candidatus Glassbacteria bacterium]|nr:hypothetical protein [Candidatus Glassbacteria bacterium]
MPTDRTWQRLGPGGGGAMFLPTVNPADPDNVFLRCDMTGAYVTHDGGKSWRMFHLRTVVRDFEFDPSDPKVIYASNTGLYRSEDCGASWKLIYPDPASIVAERMVGDHAEQFFVTREGEMRGEIVKVRVDPSDGSHIYMGLTPPYESTPADGKRTRKTGAPVLVTSDRGENWRELARVPGSTVLAIIPGTWDGRPDELTVVTDKCVAWIKESTGEVTEYQLPDTRAAHADAGVGPEGSVLYLMTSDSPDAGYLPAGEGVYRSDDRGQSWRKVMQGLLDDTEVSGKSPVFSTIAVCEKEPEVVYLSCNRYNPAQGGNHHFGIFKSTDSGESWRWVFRAEFDNMISGNYDGGWLMEEYGPEWGENPFSIGVSPSNPDIAYGSDFGCTHRTLDGGKTWEQVYTDRQPDGSWVSRGLDVTVCYGVQFDPFDSYHLFANYTDIGALQSFNGGESWVHATEGIPHAWINGCYWTVFDPEVRGRAWSVWSGAHDLPRPKMFRSGNFDRYAGGAAVSDDGGRSWRVSNAGLPENCPSTYIVLDENSPLESRTLYLCGFGKGVFKSTDGGANWSKGGAIPGPNKNAWQLALLPTGRLVLLVARGLENRQLVDGGVFTSDDAGESWQTLSLPQGVNAPNALAVDPAKPERMFLALWPRTENGRETGGGLLRTEDSGKSWQRVFREDAHVFSVALEPENPSRVYINTFDSAAFTSADGGRSWNKIRGYDFKWGHRVIPDLHKPGMIFLTTFGGGLFHGPGDGDPRAVPDIVDFSQDWRWGL